MKSSFETKVFDVELITLDIVTLLTGEDVFETAFDDTVATGVVFTPCVTIIPVVVLAWRDN